MKVLRCIALSTTVWTALSVSLLATPAVAGDKVLYAPLPAWVEQASLPANSKKALQILDEQSLFEEGRVTSYRDFALYLDSPQTVQQASVVSVQWMPDKGDATVHAVTIYRKGEAIDVLGQGAQFTVLRREQQLENRILDGRLTATLTVPDLRVGDTVRMAVSITSSDQVMGKEVQGTSALMTAPLEAGFARARIMWPSKADMKWQLYSELDSKGLGAKGQGTDKDGVIEAEANGFKSVTVALPLKEPAKVPDDAPSRYKVPPFLIATSFTDWAGVSKVMAPYYDTKGLVKKGDPVAAEIAAIQQNHTGQLAQAVAALQLVQNEVSYLMNGMDGGNYLPQSPADTWANRYGDCKAKSLLLLTMLHAMGIEAEVVAVSTVLGSTLSTILPMAGAFDHVIVKAVIDGTVYWLDGTDGGTTLANVQAVPAFQFALPLRKTGAVLEPMELRRKTTPDISLKFIMDARPGLDVHHLFEAEYKFSGALAHQMQALTQASEDQLRRYAAGFSQEDMGTVFLDDIALDYDEASGIVTLRLTGIQAQQWNISGEEMTFEPSLYTSQTAFKPDRSRAAWRDIPVDLGDTEFYLEEHHIHLPENPASYTEVGALALDVEVAGMQLKREGQWNGSSLVLKDAHNSLGGEISAAAAAAERSRMNAIKHQYSIKTVFDAAGQNSSVDIGGNPLAWIASLDGDRTRYQALDDRFESIIAKDPENYEVLHYRAGFRNIIHDVEGAVESTSAAIALRPTENAYMFRASLYESLGQWDKALADAEAAAEYSDSFRSLTSRALYMSRTGKAKAALALLEDYEPKAEEVSSYVYLLAELDAVLGDKGAGLERFEAPFRGETSYSISTRDPGYSLFLCLYKVSFSYTMGDALDVCDDAVEMTGQGSRALIGRALARYRLGQNAAALKDADLALKKSYNDAVIRYVRGVIRNKVKQGDGDQDLRYSAIVRPSIKEYMQRFGL